MKTYITISLTKEDVDRIGHDEKGIADEIENVLDAALTLMVGGKLVQFKLTNLPLYIDD